MLTAEMLSNWLQAQAREKSDWKIGTEHEKFIFDLNTKQVNVDRPHFSS